MLAADHADPSTTPPKAATGAAATNMDGRKSCRLWTLDFGLWTLDFRCRGFLYEPHGGCVQLSQFGFARFVFRKFHEIAAFEKSPETFLLIAGEQIRALEFIQKFLRGPFRRAEVKAFFEISSCGVRHGDYK